MAIHAIGDRAIDQVVNVVEKINPSRTSEIRMEHAQLISQATAKRAKALGIRLCMQPNFSDDSVYYADRLPTGFPERNNPFRMLIDEVGYVVGEDLFFGSDGMPHGIHEGLRQALFPDPRYQQQRLTLAEFIAGYCMPDEEHGHIEVDIDAVNRAVQCRIFPSPT
jgi:predicted amidohydrolase YtcJ